MQVKGYVQSVIGGREMNQDSYLINDSKKLYAVADGVGGGMKGEVASKMATDGLEKYFVDPAQKLSDIVSRIQEEIYTEAMNTFGEPIMGTTLTTILINENFLNVTHVGDSRCYLYTQSLLRQLTEDQEFYDESLKATVLSSYLGIPSDVHPLRISEDKVELRAGDRILLCSDGLYRQIPESRVITLLRTYENQAQALVDQLCHEASQKEYSDNVTVLVVEVTE